NVSKKSSVDLLSSIISIVDRVNFFYRYNYGNALGGMSSATRKLLEKYDASLLTPTPEITYAQRLQPSLELDICFAHNLIPFINDVAGWTPDTINAGTFLSCLDLSETISQNHDATYDIVSRLYCKSENWAHDLQTSTVEAVLINFQAYCKYLFTRTRFRLLFSKSCKSRSTMKVATNLDQMYSLCKRGYGSPAELEKCSILHYFTFLLNELFESVRKLHAQGMSVVEIADKTNLTVEEVSSLC
ncbi:MAG: hypothetical protein RR141_06535, partial [Rikenellaceae bacterium]